jgi:hypothetical protein
MKTPNRIRHPLLSLAFLPEDNSFFFFLISNSFIEEEPPSIQEIYLMT